MAHAIDRPADEVMVVLPADQAVQDEAGFRDALAAAAERARERDLVTLGVEPTEPSTGYGYVRAIGEAIEHGGATDLSRGALRGEAHARTRPRAHRFPLGLLERRHLRLAARRRHRRAGGRYSADISDPIRDWCAGHAPSGEAGWPGAALAETYQGLRDTSIDYALLEPASLEAKVAVVPISVGWSDLGSWSALRDQRATEGGAVI